MNLGYSVKYSKSKIRARATVYKTSKSILPVISFYCSKEFGSNPYNFNHIKQDDRKIHLYKRKNTLKIRKVKKKLKYLKQFFLEIMVDGLT